MRPRYLSRAVEMHCLAAGKMALVSGPRQCGKTTLARMLLARRRRGAYWNWDDVEFRRRWTRSPGSVLPPPGGRSVPLVALDEIHKDRRWKGRLKGIYDTLERPCHILVTGSARLNVYRKGSDSLLGRYFHFRLHPFSLREMRRPDPGLPDRLLDGLFGRRRKPHPEDERNLRALMDHGPFPEPLFRRNRRHTRLWRRSRTEILVREDLRDLSRIPELGRIEMLAALLPERVGSLFSVNALREELEVTHDTVRRWLDYLHELFYLFEVKPYFQRIPRSLKKEGKIYLWDFGEVEDEAARFENLVACHLLKACHYWTDTGEGHFALHYLRNKEKQEIDFLVVRDRVPWLPVEVKLHDRRLSSSWKKYSAVLPCKRGVQVVLEPTREMHRFASAEVVVVGAAALLSLLV